MQILAIATAIAVVCALQPIPTQGPPHRGGLFSVALVVRRFAGVPAAQGDAGEPGHQHEQGDASERNQQQRSKHARDVELKACLQDLVRQPCTLAPGARHKLRHHGADERQAAGDAQPAKEVGQRAGDAQAQQRLQPRGAVELEVALRRPSVVLLMMGNRATSAAQITMDAVGSFTQMMMSGATATMGVTCSSTA